MTPLNDLSLTTGPRTFSPPLFLAPMAGITHSALRRLIADFGGHGALFTEMLSATALLGEDLRKSPFTRRREHEGQVIYQIRFSGGETESIERVIARVAQLDPAGIDINLGCPAPEIRKLGAGVELFQDLPRLENVLSRVRKAWSGLLSIKCRIGAEENGWKKEFEKRLRVFENTGVELLFVHPRLFGEKLKRSARWRLFADIASMTSIPVVANGDITTPSQIESNADVFSAVKGIMLGRIAAVKPWIFREFAGDTVAIDYKEVWEKLYEYILEDFMPEKALGRIKEFTTYYSRNFFFGHTLYAAVQGSYSLEQLRDKALAFLDKEPRVVGSPSVGGI